MISILLIILTISCLVTGFLYVTRTRELTVARDERDEFHQIAIESAREAERALTEKLYAQATLAQVLQRPVIAQLTEENIQQLGAIMQGMLGAPDRMN